MSASRMPALSPIDCNPSARLTAVVDLPTPPLPEATAIMCLMPGTSMVCRARRGRPWRRRRVSRRGAAAPARACCTLALSAARPPADLRSPIAAALGPPGFSAVSTAMTPVTPGMSRTTFSAACRNGSSSGAYSGRHRNRERDATVLQQDLRHQPQVDDVALQVRPSDLTQPFEDLFLAEAHGKISCVSLWGDGHLPATGGRVTNP